MKIVNWALGALLIVLWVIGNTISNIIGKPIKIEASVSFDIEVCGEVIKVEMPFNLMDIKKEAK